MISKNFIGYATSGYLVEVEKVTAQEWEEWRRKYFEAFWRECSATSGLCFGSWVVN